MIIKNGKGENQMFVTFEQLALNQGYCESLYNLFSTRKEEIDKANEIKPNSEKPLQVFVKTSDRDVCELRKKGCDQPLSPEDLLNFLTTIKNKLVQELVAEEISNLEIIEEEDDKDI